VATFPLTIRNAQLDAHNARTLARITLETGGNVQEERERRVLARGLGDTRGLRGIPAIGRHVTGAIPGTSPHLAR
jgi:hypothetical protein